MKSMTGYGKGVAVDDGLEIIIELRSVNNRFLEINTRLPKNLLACDELIRTTIPKHLARGSVDVYFSCVYPTNVKGITADFAAIKQYVELTKTIQKETGLVAEISFSNLLSQGLISQEMAADNPEKMLTLTAAALISALKNLEEMRKTEGKSICSDLLKLVAKIEKDAAKISERLPDVIEEYKNKLSDRITNALSGVEIDQAKLLNEVAFFVDKSDINEELQRLSSHIDQFRQAAKSNESMGRKLDFIGQELGREINTLGSKSSDVAITATVIEMKNTLEKIKEQVRNVE